MDARNLNTRSKSDSELVSIHAMRLRDDLLVRKQIEQLEKMIERRKAILNDMMHAKTLYRQIPQLPQSLRPRTSLYIRQKEKIPGKISKNRLEYYHNVFRDLDKATRAKSESPLDLSLIADSSNSASLVLKSKPIQMSRLISNTAIVLDRTCTSLDGAPTTRTSR